MDRNVTVTGVLNLHQVLQGHVSIKMYEKNKAIVSVRITHDILKTEWDVGAHPKPKELRHRAQSKGRFILF